MSYPFNTHDPPRNPAAAPALFLRNATLPMLTQFVDVDNEPASAINSPDVHRVPDRETLCHLRLVYHLDDSIFSASDFVNDYFNDASPVKLSDWAKLPSRGFKSLKERARSIVPDNVPELSMRLLEGLCAQTQGLIHATGEYMDHCFLPQSHALPARELEAMEAYDAHSPCNMETLFWGRTDPISGNIESKMAVVVLAPWTFRSGHLVEFNHTAPKDDRGTPFTVPDSGISCALWAKLLRTCVQLGIHYWVVTNYNEFIFGSFSELMTTVFLTETLRCDSSDPSISEAMFFWTMSSVNANLPRSFEIPSIPMELSPIPNPYRRNWAILRESIRSNSKKRRYDDSEDDADSSEPPVVASSSLPVYKIPAPTTKKRKLGAVTLKENTVAGPSTPRRRTTSFVPNAGRVPTLVQSNLPSPSKIRLIGSVLTKQSSFGMSNQGNSLHLLHAIPTTDEKAYRTPAPVPVPSTQDLSPKSAAERGRVNMALAVIAPRPLSGPSSSLSSSRPALSRQGMATPHPKQAMKALSPIQSPPQRPIVVPSVYHRSSQSTSGAQSRPAVSFAPPSADEPSFPHHLRSKSVPVPAVPASVSPPMKKARFSAGTTPAHPKSILHTPHGSIDESVPSDDERMPTQLDRVQAWNSTVRDTAMAPPSVKWDATTTDLASPSPCTAESPAATNPLDKFTDAQLADLSRHSVLESNPAVGKIWQPVWDTSTLTGSNKEHHHTRVRERHVGMFARMQHVDPGATRQQVVDLSKRMQKVYGEPGAKRELGGPWLFAPKSEGKTQPNWEEGPSVAPRFASSKDEVYEFEMGLFAPSPAGASQLETPAPTPQPVDLDQAFEMEMESSVKDIVRREVKMKYEAEAEVRTPQGVASPSSSQNSELAFQPIPRSIDGLGDYAIQATIYGKEFFLNEDGSIIDHGDFMEFEGEFTASSQETSSLHEEERDGDGDSEMSPSQQQVRISTSQQSEGSSVDAEGSTDSDMEAVEALVTPVRPQSVAPFYDAYVAEDYPTPTAAQGMHEPIQFQGSEAGAGPCDAATPQYHCATPGASPQDPLVESPPWELFYSHPSPYYPPDHIPSVSTAPNLGHPLTASILRVPSSSNLLPSPLTAPTPPLVGIPTRTPSQSYARNASGTWNPDSLKQTPSASRRAASFTAPWTYEDSSAAEEQQKQQQALFEDEDNA